jgi:hypothetical protein
MDGPRHIRFGATVPLLGSRQIRKLTGVAGGSYTGGVSTIPAPASRSVTLSRLCLLVLGAVVLAQVGLSLRWRMQHDLPLMLYLTWLLRHGAVPYRDVFDMNCPGTYAAYSLLTSLFGYSDLGLRLADLCGLAALSGLTCVLLRPWRRLAALTAVALFAIAYLGQGPSSSLQREFLLLLPVVLGLTVASGSRPAVQWRGLIAGACLGAAMTIKPQAALFVPVYVLLLLGQEEPRSSPGRRAAVGTMAALAAGMAVAPLLAGLYLWRLGAWPYFWDIAVHYWPLYGQMNGEHEILAGAERFRYMVVTWLGGGWLAWLPLALWARYGLPRPSDHRQQVWWQALVLLAILSVLYPLLSGQFWSYHWLPALYALSLLAGLALRPGPGPRSALRRAVTPVLLALLLATTVRWYPAALVNPPKEGRPDAIAAYLRAHLRPGDTVQPLDWARGGVVHGMLMAEAPLATRFLYSFHFYHHVSTPYIQALRAEFLSQLRARRPRFIIETTIPPPWPVGLDTTRDFPELQRLLAANYRVALLGQGFTVHELPDEHD